MHLVLRQSFRTLFYNASVPFVQKRLKIEAKKKTNFLLDLLQIQLWRQKVHQDSHQAFDGDYRCFHNSQRSLARQKSQITR